MTIARSRRSWAHRKWWWAWSCTEPGRDYEKRLGTIWRNIMKSNKELDSILDKVANEISNDIPASSQVNAAAERVWARLSAEGAVTLQTSLPVERIESCRDFQSLIPS